MNDLAAALILGLARTTALLAVAALAVYGLLRLTRASSPAVHRAAWCLVLLQGWLWFRLPVGIPWYEAVGPALPAESAGGPPRDPQPGHGVTGLLSAPAESKPEANPAGTAGPTEADSAIPAHTAGPTEAAQPLWPVILTAVWFAGMGLLVAGWLGCYLVFLSLLPRGQRAGEGWIDQWEELLRSRRIRRAIPMRVTVRTGPVLCRLPRGYQLLVPAALWERLDPAGRLSILRHELAHLERGDVWKSLCVRLLALPHWFNPLAWWAVRRFDEAAEWACDQAVCGASRNARPEYAKALVLLGESAAPVLFRPAARGRRLSQRIRRLLDSDPKEDSLMKKLLVLGAALGLALVCLVRFDLVAKEPAAENVVGVGPALPAESTDAAIPAGGASPTAAESKPAATASPAGTAGPTDAVKSETPRPRFSYDGKVFIVWERQLRNDLSPQRQTEAIKALTAFGAHGYGKQAAEAIVAAMREYRGYSGLTGTDVDKLKEAALIAFAGGRPRDSQPPGIDPKDTVPVLIRELKEGPPNGRLFAVAALMKIEPPDKSAIPALAEAFRRDKDTEVRLAALDAVAALDEAGDATISLVVEVVQGHDARLAVHALSSTANDVFSRYGMGRPMRKGARGYAGGLRPGGSLRRRVPMETSDLDELKPLVKAVIGALNHEDLVVSRTAASTLWYLTPAMKKDAVPAVIQLIEQRSPSESLLVVGILRGLGSEAKAALPALEKLEADAKRSRLSSDLLRELNGTIREIKGEAPAPGPGGFPPGAAGPPKPAAPGGKPASKEKTAEPRP